MNTNHPKAVTSIKPPVSVTSSKKAHDITGGPSRDRLFDSCKYAQDSSSMVGLDFQVVEFYIGLPSRGAITEYKQLDMREVRITGIEHEDGSGFKFNIKGRCLARFRTDVMLIPYRFTAFYNTNSREGTISFYD